MEERDKITISLPAKHLYLSIVGDAIEGLVKRLGGSERNIYDIQIALQEICANVVDHAYKGLPIGQMEVVVQMHDSHLCLVVSDQGNPFDESQTKDPELGQLQDRGYGLFFAKKLMDVVRYERVNSQNRWILQKKLSLPVEVTPFQTS